MHALRNMALRALNGALLTTLWLSAPAGAADVSAGLDGFIPCGDDDGTCRIPAGDAQPSEPIFVSFGSGDQRVLSVYSDASAVPCNTDQGDPAPGQPKKCYFTTTAQVAGFQAFGANNNKVENGSQDYWRMCSDEGATCDMPTSDGIHWVMYGAKNSADGFKTYQLQAGSIACSNAWFGVDPAPGIDKACYVATPAMAKRGDFKGSCASENQACGSLKQSSGIFRYGMEGKYLYQLREAGSQGLACGNAAAGRDPAPGEFKSCAWLPLPESLQPSKGVARAVGRWAPVETNISEGKSTVQHSINVGSSLTHQTDESQDWRASLSATLTQGVEIEAGVATVSASYSVTAGAEYGRSVVNSDAFAETKGTSQTVTCEKGAGAEKVALYQYVIESHWGCVNGGKDCAGSAKTETLDTICISGSVEMVNHTKPQCLPLLCKDVLCQTCE